jgi:hypothetical protein
MSTSERISEVRPLETRRPKGIKGFSIAAIAAIAVLLSMAFPYGIGLLLIVWTAAIIGAVVGTGIVCFKLAKEVLSGSLSFNYSPTMAYLTGKKGGKQKREASGPNSEKSS